MSQTTKMEKVTFSLPAELVQQLRAVVSEGTFASQNALVRTALRRELKRERDERFAREMKEAARDPLFTRDVSETMDAFAFSDGETARLIPLDEEFDVEA